MKCWKEISKLFECLKSIVIFNLHNPYMNTYTHGLKYRDILAIYRPKISSIDGPRHDTWGRNIGCQKVCNVLCQPLGQSINYTKYIYTQIQHINIIFFKCFKEQINYNYFIIKWNFFIYLNNKNIKIIVIIFFIVFLISLIY